MNSLGLLALGIMQGIFEWLPVSSEGQLFLLGSFIGMGAHESLRIALFLHLGTSLAAFIYYRKEYLRALMGGEDLQFLVVGTLSSFITAAPIALFLEEVVSSYEEVLSMSVGFLLIAVGLLLRRAESSLKVRDKPGLKDAVITGLAQGVALMPGVSRSAMTISALMLRGFDLRSSFRYSFMLGGIATLLAGLSKAGDPASWWVIVPTTLTGFLALGLLDKISNRVRMSTFSIGFGLLSLALACIKILGGFYS